MADKPPGFSFLINERGHITFQKLMPMNELPLLEGTLSPRPDDVASADGATATGETRLPPPDGATAADEANTSERNSNTKKQ